MEGERREFAVSEWGERLGREGSECAVGSECGEREGSEWVERGMSAQ